MTSAFGFNRIIAFLTSLIYSAESVSLVLRRMTLANSIYSLNSWDTRMSSTCSTSPNFSVSISWECKLAKKELQLTMVKQAVRARFYLIKAVSATRSSLVSVTSSANFSAIW